MTIGEKIKLARNLRGITQKELGFLVKLQDVRIRQYETDVRTPKYSQLHIIAEALGVPMEFFSENSLESTAEIMHVLFELEQSRGITIHKIIDEQNKVTKYALTFDNRELNNAIGNWYDKIERMKLELNDDTNDRTKESIESDYLAWKVRYPLDMLDEMERKLSAKRKELASKDNE